MKLTIEIPDKNLQDFADTFSLINDETLQQQGETYLSKHVYSEMRIKITHDSESEIKAIIDSKLQEGEIKPALNDTIK